MANLRIILVNVIDSTDITVKFTDNLDPSIDIANVSILSQSAGVPDSSPLTVSITGPIMNIVCQPLTPYAAYYLTFQSVPETIFKSINGTSVLQQDGVQNRQLIIGPSEPDNVAQDFLVNYLRDQIYSNVTDTTTIINKILQSLAQIMSKSLYDIRQVKNENYLSFSVIDEKKNRGSGPFDRLDEEGAYEILRVGLTPTGTNSLFTNIVPLFGRSPITLLATSATDFLTSFSSDAVGKFNINDFILTVTNKNVTKLTGVIFTYTNGNLPFVYDIQDLGYQIQNSLYDQDFGFSFAALDINQFKLSTTILNNSEFSLENIDQIQVSYEYKDLGRIIDPTSVKVTTVLQSSRETLSPIENIFNLQNAPITDINGNTPLANGVTFIDPNAYPPSAPHPAFLVEIPFRLNALPAHPGEYSIDYPNGTVYVFGSDTTNNGTEALPPLATYNYLHTYKSSIDYAYDPDPNDLVALPGGSLINNSGTITFNYEQVLIPGIDYQVALHIENLDERIQNRLLALNVLQTKNSPVTNVFRIFNETTGEIYTVTRWNGNKVYFSFNNPPNILSTTAERATFQDVLNELLFVNNTLTNTSGIKVFQCLLQNNKIIDASEDGLGSSINSSAKFSNTQVFVAEKWLDIHETQSNNINRITQIGQYEIDYANGIVYVGVSSIQNINIGTVSYKNDSVVPQNPHVISVDDIYYRISISNPKDKSFVYQKFFDGSIIPANFDVSDEAYLNGVLGSPYQILSGKVGAFVDATFQPIVTNNVKFVRGLFEFNDLNNSINPLNFANFSTSSSKNISINSFVNQGYNTVLFDGTNHYVSINANIPYLSPNITFTVSIVRTSDSAQLWNSSGTIVPGTSVKLILPGINAPATGDAVFVIFTATINDLSRIIVDYNKGEYYIDYSYLADEIIISYEYGENQLDFRQSLSISAGDQYFASYKVGALRDALLKNFGTLVNIPDLTTFDINYARERYRDALSAALSSFIQGPTVTAMKSLVEQISHIEPQLIESAFQNWSLGSSTLNPRGLQTTGEFALVPAKYGNGVVIDSPGQTITLPASSNIRLEEGTFESWIVPEWNGIDNDTNLNVSVTKDGYTLPSDQIFVGAGEFHPNYINNIFTLNKLSEISGLPNKNKDGVFIYYAPDQSGLFDRWYVEVVDGYSDGYNDGYNTTYNVKITTPGLFYDVKSLTTPKPNNLSIRSGTGTLNFTIISGPIPLDEGITFVADREHYILDFGTAPNKDRISLFKDPSGYMNFRVFDKNKVSSLVSADVSQWNAGEQHHVAASWNLNTTNNRDEIHLFIDGFEVPNIIRYGTNVHPYLHEKFRTINPEEIAGVITKNIVGSTDLITTSGSPVVSSLINFSANGISSGATLFIDEPGFNPTGYSVISVSGQTLTLSVPMPSSIINGKYSVNRTSIIVSTEIAIYPNITVSTISSILDGTDLTTTNNSNTVTSTGTNFSIAGVQSGYLLRIDNLSFQTHYVILSVSGNSLVLNGNAPLSLTNATFHVYQNKSIEIPGQRALRPDYSITQDANFNYLLVISNAAHVNDLILIQTLGINHKRIVKKYYQWGNLSNVIATKLPPPVALGGIIIDHILLTTTAINTSNSTVIAGVLTSNQLSTDQPSTSDNGRTISVTITTTNNINFTTPVSVIINGTVVGSGTVTETITFTSVGTQNSVHKFSTINYVQVSGTPINSNKTFLVLTVQEAFPITTPENSTVYPVIRYSYQIRAGVTLAGSGNLITDPNGFFSVLDINNYIVITSPGPVAGTYQILSVSSDHKTATINAILPTFTNGIYQILNATTFRSGLQNGYFLFENANQPGVPYNIIQGLYQFDYYTYLSVKFDPINENAYLGTDLNGTNQLNGILDEVKIYAIKLSDNRVGESVPVNTSSITKDFNSLKALQSDINTLVLAHFDTFPFVNSASFYVRSENKAFVQSGVAINENFGQSVKITRKPIIVDNDGILNSRLEGTIEFWINPLLDTQNDPNYRFYFDASATVIEKVISTDDVSVRVTGKVGKILSVKLQNGNSTIDYFDGGKVEIDTLGAISEETLSTTASEVFTSKLILQVITVKIAGDPTNTDYFSNGTIGTDRRTIFLGKQLPHGNLGLIVTYKPADGSDKSFNTQIIRLNRRLPNQQTPVIVTYVPNGAQGDRISIFKDPFGFINFDVNASGIDYLVRAPAIWARNTWHRIKATYEFNGGQGQDQIHLFVDGYEMGNILFGTGLIFGDPHVFGSTFVGSSPIISNIIFKDNINELYIGSDFTQNNTAFALLDNLRISDIARPIFAPFGESIDVNYNTNLNVVFPVTEDLFTTLLMDFDTLITLNTDFATLKNKKTGLFDFTLNIFDSFGIISSSGKVKEVLETLIKTLKPANSRVFIQYIT